MFYSNKCSISVRPRKFPKKIYTESQFVLVARELYLNSSTYPHQIRILGRDSPNPAAERFAALLRDYGNGTLW